VRTNCSLTGVRGELCADLTEQGSGLLAGLIDTSRRGVIFTITLPGTWVALFGGMSSSLLSLVWWVAIGLFFFWMMSRGGCGGMMGRGHHRESGRANGHSGHSTSGKPIDPVCGMEVDPAKAAATRIAGRETYFFCSQNCLDAFDKNPAMYTRRHDEHAGHHHHAC
jgi:YHS domain-containing protein